VIVARLAAGRRLRPGDAPRGVGYDDMHGQPGVTTQALAAWLRWRRKGRHPQIWPHRRPGCLVGGADPRCRDDRRRRGFRVTYPDTAEPVGRQDGRRAAMSRSAV
jgi:hypothetical protein